MVWIDFSLADKYISIYIERNMQLAYATHRLGMLLMISAEAFKLDRGCLIITKFDKL